MILKFGVDSLLGCTNERDLAYLEECIFKGEPMNKVLKLLCLLCLSGALKQKQIEFFEREVLQVRMSFQKTFENYSKHTHSFITFICLSIIFYKDLWIQSAIDFDELRKAWSSLSNEKK
jgi:hypothetical protein